MKSPWNNWDVDPTKISPQTCELWEPNRLGGFASAPAGGFASKKFHPAPRNCTLSAELWGLWCHCFGCRDSFPPVWGAHLWCIVSDQYLKNDDHIYQVTRLTHQDGMLRPVKMLIFLRTLGCCFLNLGSEASTSSDLVTSFGILAKDSTEVYPASSKTSPNMPWPVPINSNTCKALTSSECTAFEMSFFSSCLSATAEGITIRQGNFGWLWRHDTNMVDFPASCLDQKGIAISHSHLH